MTTQITSVFPPREHKTETQTKAQIKPSFREVLFHELAKRKEKQNGKGKTGT